MNCATCNQPIPDDSLFCEHCGASLPPDDIQPTVQQPIESDSEESAAVATTIASDTAAGETYPAPVSAEAVTVTTAADAPSGRTSETKAGTPYATVGIFAGALCLIAAVVGFVMAPEAAESASFGGDFYTYTYQGIAALSDSLALLVRLLCVSMAAFGVFLICHFGWLLTHSRRG